MKLVNHHHLKPIIFLCQFFLIATLIIACHSTEINTSTNTNNNGCIQKYDHNTDYFPNKIKITRTTGFAVEYHKHYKIITIKNPWQNANTKFQYVLVQCGTPTPKGFNQARVITVPINSIVSLSTTHLPHLAKLGVVDKLIGISNSKQVNTPDVFERIKAGKLTQVGDNSNVDIEKVLELNPDFVTTFGTGNSQTDSYTKLTEAIMEGVISLRVSVNFCCSCESVLQFSHWS
ncbi:hypothetical protein [Nostoc sp.]|uniref:hypothetical protein n=1 Tax=Nostoc sp. TaxID=1180 RepID=UPI003FA58745